MKTESEEKLSLVVLQIVAPMDHLSFPLANFVGTRMLNALCREILKLRGIVVEEASSSGALNHAVILYRVSDPVGTVRAIHGALETIICDPPDGTLFRHARIYYGRDFPLKSYGDKFHDLDRATFDGMCEAAKAVDLAELELRKAQIHQALKWRYEPRCATAWQKLKAAAQLIFRRPKP